MFLWDYILFLHIHQYPEVTAFLSERNLKHCILGLIIIFICFSKQILTSFRSWFRSHFVKYMFGGHHCHFFHCVHTLSQGPEGDNFSPFSFPFPFPSPAPPRNPLVENTKTSIRPDRIWAAAGRYRREIVRKVLQEDNHGSEWVWIAERMCRIKGQKKSIEKGRKEKERESEREEQMARILVPTTEACLLSSTKEPNTGCYCPRRLCLLLPMTKKCLCSDIQIPLQGQVQATQRLFLLFCY